MSARALEWSRAHPDSSPGYASAVARLEDRLKRAEQLADQQRDGILEVRRATARKRELRRQMKLGHLPHLTKVAIVASAEEPELAAKFAMPGRVNTYSGFRTAARGIAAEADSRKELLVKYGLSETVLAELNQLLDELDEVVEQGALGRAAHVGASIALESVANELVQVVGIKDALNRVRFATNPELLSAWENASNVVATPKPAEKPGEVTPAA